MNRELEKATVSAFVKGSEAAFGKLFRSYYPKLMHFATRMVKSRDDAEEIVQEVFIKLWHIRHKIDHNRSLRSLLYTIARNMAYDYLKKTVSHEELTEALWNRLELMKNHTEEAILFQECKDITDKAIQTLPPQKQLIFRLSRDSGLSYEEISVQLGISKNTVKNHMIEALKSLKSYFLLHEELPRTLIWLLIFLLLM